MGHSRAGRGPDATSGAPLPPQDPDVDDPDHIAGPRWAIDIGDHRARQAYRRCTRHLAIAEVRLYWAVVLLGRGYFRQPALVNLQRRSTYAEIDRAAAGIGWRLDALEAGLPKISGDRLSLVLRFLHGSGQRPPSARASLDLAVRDLDKLFARGRATEATGEERCRICRIRLRAERAGGRCNTCMSWRTRNGSERPQSLDSVRDAYKAQRRRRERGEGWGAA